MDKNKLFIYTILIGLLTMPFSKLKAANNYAKADSSLYKVYFFLATTCPISQQYTLEIKRLDSLYSKKNIEFIVVFPSDGKKSIRREVKKFISEYKILMQVLVDKKFKLTNELKATVTPEVFLVDQKSKILYHGAIDNWFYALGKNRLEITAHYFEEALVEAINLKQIKTAYVAPVGCFIEPK